MMIRVGLALSVCLLSVAAGAAVPCLRVVAGAPDVATLRDAWSVESTKAGIVGAAVKIVHAPSDCPSDGPSVRLAPDGQAVLLGPRGLVRDERNLAGLSSWESARELARMLLASADSDAHLGPLDGDGGSPTPGPRVGGWLGGRYTLQEAPGMHQGALLLDSHVALLSERLLLGLRLDWSPAQDLGTVPGSAQLQAVAVAAHIGWRVRIDPVWLRVSTGLLLEWRRLTVEPRARLDIVEEDLVTGGALLELALDVPVWRRLRLGLAVGLRAWFDGTGYRWDGELVYPGPLVSGVASLRVGWWWNG